MFGEEYAAGEEMEAAKDAFLKEICKHVENLLENRQCLISANEPTIIDIAWYNEMITVILLMRIKGIKKMFPRFAKWSDMMSKSNELQDVIDKLLETISEHDLE